jgi:Xaa-Pro aminopeptidase
MLYLTGVTEDQSAVLITKRPIVVDGKPARVVLFVATRIPSQEIWTGIRMGTDVAGAVTGIEAVLPISAMRGVLDSLLPKLTTLYYDGYTAAVVQEPLTGKTIFLDSEARESLENSAPKLRVRDAGEVLNKMRMIKSPAEIALMRKAINITVEAHKETIRSARPGMHEYELESIMEYNVHRLGSEEPAYPSIVGAGHNSCILHYETTRRQSTPGDVIVMDCGAEYHGYAADVTRTIPIDGKFTDEQRAIYDLVYEAQSAGIDACRAGNKFYDPHFAAKRVLAAGLLKLGIITSESQVDTYFMHGTSHFLGMDVRDVGQAGPLKEGMVMTVEPGLYIPAGSDCDRKWWGIGVRIEDDILITANGPDNLSGALPRTSAAIEELMASGKTTVVGGR